MKKTCPKHGDTLEGREGNYCPTCGDQLVKIPITPWIRILIPRKLGLLFFIPFTLFALNYFFGVAGCISGCDQQYREREAEEQRVAKSIIATLDEKWATLYIALNAAYQDRRDNIMEAYVEKHSNSNNPPLKKLSGDELNLFLCLFLGSHRDDMFPIFETLTESKE